MNLPELWDSTKIFLVITLILLSAAGFIFADIVSAQHFSEGVLGSEDLSRALFASCTGTGDVHLSWRFFEDDPIDTVFSVFRSEDGVNFDKIGDAGDSSNFIDANTVQGRRYHYRVGSSDVYEEEYLSNEAEIISGDCDEYHEIDIRSGDGTSAMVPGDIDGDGLFDFIIKRPENAGEGDYYLEAYTFYGDFLWNYDLGIGNDPTDDGPIWINSYTVWDMDGDRKAEVIARTGNGNDRFLTMIDGLSGNEIRKVPWPSVPEWDNWAWHRNEDRHVLVIAYLDGNKPYIVLQVGTYAYGGNPPDAKGRVKIIAYDNELNMVWERQGLGDGAAGHGLRIVDYDDDGNDEIVQGSNLIDENGNLLWTVNLGHVDRMIPGDIDYDNPGYEIFYSQEPWGTWMRQYQWKAGNYLIDMDDGSIIWKDTGYNHLHSDNWGADVTGEHPGWELWSFDKPPDGSGDVPLLYNAQGELIDSRWLYNRPPIWWDDDDYWELTSQSGNSWHIRNYPELDSVKRVSGDLHHQGDIIGDFRDELIALSGNYIRIYPNTDHTEKRIITPLQDRYYRKSLSMLGTGYYHNVQVLDKLFYSSEPCNCGEWSDDSCGAGQCDPEHMLRKRECTPSGCASEERCVETDECLNVCSDETPYNECSDEKPKYCDNGELVLNCDLCGCPDNERCNDTAGECIYDFVLDDGWNLFFMPKNMILRINETQCDLNAYELSKGRIISVKEIRPSSSLIIRSRGTCELGLRGEDVGLTEKNVNPGWNVLGSLATMTKQELSEECGDVKIYSLSDNTIRSEESIGDGNAYFFRSEKNCILNL